MHEYFNVISQSDVFTGMHQAAIQTALLAMHSYMKSYEKQQTVFWAGEPCLAMGILVEGTANIIKQNLHGEQTLVSELIPGDLFGETIVLANVPSPVSVVATSACKVLFFDFLNWDFAAGEAALYHIMMNRMLQSFAKKNILLHQKNELLSERTTRRKLLHYFDTESFEQGSNQIQLTLSRKELAEYLCVDRSSMCRELSALQEEGILRYDKQTVTLLQ